MFHHDCIYNVRLIFKNLKPCIFRIPKNHSIPNTPLRCLNFSFSIEGLFNLNCLQGKVEKGSKQLNFRLTLETIIRFKIVR